MRVFESIGYVIIGLGFVFMLLGILGIFRFKDFYTRIVVASKIDTVGALTIIIGMAFIHGFSFFTAKLALIMIVMLILNPMVAHVVARSAYVSGYKPDSDDDAQNHEIEVPKE